MDAQMRKYFLRELMILQTNNNISNTKSKEEAEEEEFKSDINNIIKDTNSTNTILEKEENKNIREVTKQQLLNNSVYQQDNSDSDKNKDDKLDRKQQVNVTFFSDSGSTGRTLSGSFVACDTNLTHILLNDLITPIGLQSSALLRLNDVIAITYC